MFTSTASQSYPTSIFRTYLLPSQPRNSSISSAASPTASDNPVFSSPNTPISPITPASSVSPNQASPQSFIPSGHTYNNRKAQQARRPSYLQGHVAQISCARCKASLALTSQIISKGFTGRHGRAYLVSPTPLDTSASPPPPPRRPSISSSTAHSFSHSSGTSPTFQRNDLGPRRRSSALSSALSNAFASLSGGSPASSSATRSSWSSAGSPSPATDLPNTHTHKAVPRQLVTGMHTVSDISCALCGNVLGWKYVAAEEEAQKYKIGKYILETRKVMVGSSWDGEGMWDMDEELSAEAVEPRGVRRAQRDRRSSSSTNEPMLGKGTDMGIRSRMARATSITWSPEPIPGSRSGIEPTPSYSYSEDHSSNDNDTNGADQSSNSDSDSDSDDDQDNAIVFDSQDEDECDDLFAGIWSPELAKQRRDSRRESESGGRNAIGRR